MQNGHYLTDYTREGQQMFQGSTRQSKLHGAFGLLELIYHGTVRDIRKTHRNAVVGLVLNILQTVIMVFVFFVMFQVLGMRGAAIRGDFLLYLMSGIFLFLTHVKAMGAVVGSDGPASPMMQHGPMNTVIAICSSACGALYIQILSISVVLLVYHIGFTPITIDNMSGALGMLLMAWFSGVAVGTIFLALKPWAPDFVNIASTIYTRANMVASGKLFVVNTLPAYLMSALDWNPLFHVIDQARGFIFLHYNPHFTSVSYPIYLSLVLLLIGLMGEFYTRKSASVSWSAGR